jgi:peptidoglycan/xylan/chitin deacetylase (PgdA/CDA1 family)
MNLPRLYKTPLLLKKLYPTAVWDKSALPGSKTIYLTFDDGPIPEVTDFVLNELHKNNLKATFFTVGENIIKYPEVFKSVVDQGHSVGNHTFNHLKGWGTKNLSYFENIEKCEMAMIDNGAVSKKLFRPPYGRISPKQLKQLKGEYEIIMWDVLTGDYNASLSSNDILHYSLNSTSHGSIVVFHDSLKSKQHLFKVLPDYISMLVDQGYQFRSL